MFEEFAETLEAKAKEAIKIVPDDYIEDGLWHCGKCRTPKQCIVKICGSERKPMCLCKCESERIDAEKKAQEDAERKRIAERRKEHIRQIGFPEPAMWSCTFENDDNSNPTMTKKMLSYVKNFARYKEENRGLLLYGNTGTGKTFSACQIANALIDDGYSVFVTSISRLANTVQGKYNKQEYIDDLNDFDLLIIDDLGTERKSEWMQELIYNILDCRYKARKPMIITTNLSMSEMLKPPSLDLQRIYDRVTEVCFPISFTGENKRRKKIEEEIHRYGNFDVQEAWDNAIKRSMGNG